MEQKEALLFVGADLSGIQKFLYNISSRKAAVSLKGRSWYLTDYMEKLMQRIADTPQIDMYTGHGISQGRVYCSGGKLYAVVRDTPQVRAAIDAMQQKCERELWEEHHGLLSINMGYVAFAFANDSRVLLEDGKEQKLGALWGCTAALFAEQKAHKFHTVIEENFESLFSPVAVAGKVCAVTGIESEQCVPLTDEKDTIYVLPSVMEQIEIGKRLQREQGFRTFEEYAAESWLGVLRMDVDGLGKKFANGFDTFADYQHFSARLSNFFDKVVKEDLQQRYRDDLMVLYAGGDDLFVVGRWDAVIDMAQEVHDRFAAQFAADGLTLSGGVVVVDPKFPIAKAAEMSGEAEDAAKHFRGGEKNAFCMLGECLSWNKEFNFALGWKERMRDLCTEAGMPRSILHKIMAFDSMRKRGDQAYLWNAAYYLSRFKSDKKNEAIGKFCDDVKHEFFNPSDHEGCNVALLALAARWAELSMRTNIKNN